MYLGKLVLITDVTKMWWEIPLCCPSVKTRGFGFLEFLQKTIQPTSFSRQGEKASLQSVLRATWRGKNPQEQQLKA